MASTIITKGGMVSIQVLDAILTLTDASTRLGVLAPPPIWSRSKTQAWQPSLTMTHWEVTLPRCALLFEALCLSKVCVPIWFQAYDDAHANCDPCSTLKQLTEPADPFRLAVTCCLMSKSALRELQHLRQLLEQPLTVPEPAINRHPQRTAEAALQEAQVKPCLLASWAVFPVAVVQESSPYAAGKCAAHFKDDRGRRGGDGGRSFAVGRLSAPDKHSP